MRTVSAVLCVLLLCSMALAAPKVLFEDDFTGDLDQWIMTNAGWEIVDEALEFPIVGFSDIFTGEDWDDYVVEAEMTPLEYGQWGSVRLFFRSYEPFTGFGLSFHEGGWIVHCFLGTYDQYRVLAEGLDLIVKPGQKVHVRMEMKGNKFGLYLDGTLVAEFEDPEDTYFDGGIGFRADNAALRVDNVKVTALR